MPVEVSHWLHGLGLGQYADRVTEHASRLEELASLSEADIRKIAVPSEYRKRLSHAVAMLAEERGTAGRADEARRRNYTLLPERRYLTVLFCDLVGSTGLSHELDPEDFSTVMNRYRRLCGRIMERFGGHLTSHLGDGVVAYFGWPQAHEDHAERGIRAALELVETAPLELAAGGREIAIRVGVSSGLVVVGAGEDGLGATDVIGETPNVASRLQALAEPNSVVIAPSTYRLTSNVFEYRDLGEHGLKGLSHPMRVRQVLRARALDSRFEAYHGQDLVPFVGRRERISLLGDLWERAKRGLGQIVLLSGEAGIGKSRLAKEFVQRCRDETSAIVYNQCSPLHTTTPLYPVIRHLWIAAELSTADSADVRAEKLRRHAHAARVETESAVAFLCSLFHIRSATVSPLPDLAPQQFRKQLVDMLWALLRGRAESGPVIAVIEDVQWIDPMTEALWLRGLAPLGQLPIFVIATSRRPFPESWRQNTHTTSIVLERFSASDSRDLVCAILPGQPDVSLVERIVARAEGVPLFLDELALALRESSASDDSVTERWSRGDIPATLQALLTERLDRLGEAKRLAQVGAVLGRQFAVEALRALAERPKREIDRGIKRLLASGLLKRQSRGASGLAFKHALVQDAAYDSLLNVEKKRLHRAALTYLEGQRKESMVEAADTLAFHAERGEAWDKAVQYLGAACAQAIAKSANREAIALFDRALESLRHLPANDAAPFAVDLRRLVCPALLAMGDIDRLIAVLREADRWASDMGDKRRQAAAQRQLAMGLWLAGEHRTGLGCAERAAAFAAEVDDFASGLIARFQVANHHHALGMVREAAEIYSSIAEALQGDLAYQRFESPGLRSVLALGLLAWCAIDLGDFPLARRAIDRAQSIVGKVPEPYSTVYTSMAEGLYHAARGDTAKAIAAFEAAHRINTESDMLLPIALAWLGGAYAQDGRAEEALALLLTAERDGTYKSGGKYCWIHHYIALAQAELALRAFARARTAIAKAREIAEPAEELAHLAWILKTSGDIEAADPEGARGAALSYYQEAIEIGRPRELRPLVARCHAGLAQIFRRSDEGVAVLHHAEADRIFREIGLPRWPLA
jgi:class 3 adenylate cyclase/tetratricopeptide (TPR) repeat protein